eukprot:TRINITY_DN25317_c0_g1_i1.p2 TRINITY_DN25317_c0_g1~~TRINITY_DN25317_c0_g1_i1.p2  ORF type:complete len:170 (+),score=36.26 TRINITY_DN25317_c0_g1_i1:141-650(+)
MGNKGKKNRGKKQAAAAAGGAAAPGLDGPFKPGTEVEVKMAAGAEWQMGRIKERTPKGYWVRLDGSEVAGFWRFPLVRKPQVSPDSPPPASGPDTIPSGSRSASGGTAEGEQPAPPQPAPDMEGPPQHVKREEPGGQRATAPERAAPIESPPPRRGIRSSRGRPACGQL